jgi:hypothetical protein
MVRGCVFGTIRPRGHDDCGGKNQNSDPGCGEVLPEHVILLEMNWPTSQLIAKK